MRPTLAIVPLALLLAWFGPSPSGETGLPSLSREAAPPASSMPAGLGQAEALVQPEPTEAEQMADQLAEAWQSIRRAGFLRTTSELSSELPPRR